MSTPKPSDAEAAQAIARALADPQRYRIVKLLAQSGEITQCAALFDAVKIAPATLSHHMKELRDAGLVVERRMGRTRQYTLQRVTVEAYLRQLQCDLLAPEQEPAKIASSPVPPTSIR